MSQNWETLTLDFNNFNTDDIADKTLQALGFHIFATRYLEKRSLCFTDVTDLKLNIEPAIIDNPGQVVTDSGEDVVKKKNKRAAKKKEWLAKLRAPVRSPLSSRLESSSCLLPRFMRTPVPALVPTPVPALGPALVPALMSAPMPAFVPALVPVLISRPRSLALLSSCHASISCYGILALLLLLLTMLGLLLFLGFSPLRTFKQSLLDKPSPRVSTSPAKFFCLFLALGAYNSTNTNERKWGFDTIFINSCLLAGNHDQKEVDLSFASCRYSDTVKLNKS